MGNIADAGEDLKRRAVEIGAQTGQAGVDAFQQAQTRIGQIQADAMARAARDAAQIGAPAGASFPATVSQSTSTLQQAVAANQAAFQGATLSRLGGAIDYGDKIKATEPYVDALLAAQAAAAAGSGGGGGGGGSHGGGGGGGGGGDLSDSETRVLLKGAATAQREQNAAAAADVLATQQAKRVDTSKQRGAVKKLLVHVASQKKPLARGVVNKKIVKQSPAKAAHGTGIPRAINRLETKRQVLVAHGKKATPHIDARLAKLQDTRNLLLQRRSLYNKARRQDVRLRGAYAGVVQAQNQPLGPIARQIGIDSGLDPERAYGLISPTEEATYNAADLKNRKTSGGPLPQLGLPARLIPKDAAKELKMPVAKARVIRQSTNYKTLSNAAQAALAQGYTLDQFSRELDTWRQPGSQRVKGKGGKYVTQKTPGHANLVNLILDDYAPAFG